MSQVGRKVSGAESLTLLVLAMLFLFLFLQCDMNAGIRLTQFLLQ